MTVQAFLTFNFSSYLQWCHQQEKYNNCLKFDMRPVSQRSCWTTITRTHWQWAGQQEKLQIRLFFVQADIQLLFSCTSDYISQHWWWVWTAEQSHCVTVTPQRCHSVAQFMYDTTEQQCDEEVSQLARGEIDTWNLEKKKKQHFQSKQGEQMTSKHLTRKEISGWMDCKMIPCAVYIPQPAGSAGRPSEGCSLSFEPVSAVASWPAGPLSPTWQICQTAGHCWTLKEEQI